MDDDSDIPRQSVQSEFKEEALKDKIRKLKNNEIVGIQLSELDYVPHFDLNKNTGDNPWVHDISSFSSESIMAVSYVNQNRADLEQPLLDNKNGDKEEEKENEDTWETRKIRNRVFYGTLIKDMRKFLIVRAPYCVVNKSSLNFEIRITHTTSKTVKSRFRV